MHPIPYERLEGRYEVDISIDSNQPVVFVHVTRGNISEDCSVAMSLAIEDEFKSSFDLFFANTGRRNHLLVAGGVAQIGIAASSPSARPAAGVTSLRCTLLAKPMNSVQISLPFTVEVRFVTSRLLEPDFALSARSEVTFGAVDGSTEASGHVILGTITPSMPPEPASYIGPPADLVLEAAAFIVLPRDEPRPLPLRAGQCLSGRSAGEGVLWSGSEIEAEDRLGWIPPARLTLPYPLRRDLHEFVVGVPTREAISIARQLGEGPDLRAEIELDVALRLAGRELCRDRRRIHATFELNAALIVSSRDISPVTMALVPNPSAPGAKASGSIRRRLNLRGAQRVSSIETAYPLRVLVITDSPEALLEVDFAFTFEGIPHAFPDLKTRCDAPLSGQSVMVPLRDIVERVILDETQTFSHVPRHGDLIVSFAFRDSVRASPRSFAALTIPVEIEMIPPDLICCIDLGTSATSVWFGAPEKSGLDEVLPLGELVHALTGDAHEEFVAGQGLRNVLLPSLIGLNSDSNLRARYDPLSLGSIELAEGGRAGAERRLMALGRSYDISVPFVARQDIPHNHDSIVFDPKRSLMATEARAPAIRAFEMENGRLTSVHRVNIPKLVTDVFDELGAYLVPRALELLEDRRPRWANGKGRSLVDDWLQAKDPIGVIVTHPSGIGAQSRQTYVEAGRRFLSRFAGVTPGASAANLWVKLVPEAIAAMNYGIGFLRDHGRLPGERDRHVLVAVDIGAGTCDVTLAQAEIGPNGLRDWTILSHFGVTVGGIDLDRAITAKVVSLLRDAFADNRVAAAFSLDWTKAGAADSATQTQRFARDLAFRDEVQRAKKALTTRLLLERPDGADYTWSAESGIALEVVVGREPDRETLPVRRNQTARVVAEQRVVIDADSALVVRPGPEGVGGVEIVFEIGMRHFTPRRGDPVDAASPVTVARFLGTVLPQMMMREVARLNCTAPIWIVTGRTALWPPLYAAIMAVADQVPGSRMASRRPFKPAEMKEAVLRGALALAASPHLPLGNDVLNPLAVVSIAAEPQAIEPQDAPSARGRRITRIGAIHYLNGSDKEAGSDSVVCSGRCELVRAMPGLSDPQADNRPDQEALQMFDAFGIPPYEILFRDIASSALSGPQRALQISWSASDRMTTMTLDAGDGAGSQRFEFSNRESRVYHD